LPDSYTVVPAVVMKKESTAVPFSSIDSQLSSCSHFNEAVQTEHAWLKHAMEALSKTKTDGEESISWAAYHASSCKVEVNCSSISQLMPLFNEHAASAAMIKHGISVQTEAIQFLNPGQIPVIAFDAPLFAIAKLVQWNWPDKYGENKCVAMMGGLHIEMAFWNTVGDYLEGSGWVSVLTQSGVALSGTAESFLNASHLMKTRIAHQVNALALAVLQERAFLKIGNSFSTQQEWKESMKQTCPMFLYWDTVLSLELTGFIFVRAHRERKFSLYLDSIKRLYHGFLPWITISIQDGCLSTFGIWRNCQHQFTMNFMRMVTGLYRKQKIDFQQCSLTRLMSKTMPW